MSRLTLFEELINEGIEREVGFGNVGNKVRAAMKGKRKKKTTLQLKNEFVFIVLE